MSRVGAFTVAWVALGAGGCATEPAPDRVAYRASLAALPQDPATAVLACNRVADPLLHGECTTFAAAALVRSGGDGRDPCGGVTHAGWRAACFFEITDAMQLRGEDARTACAQAGTFSDRCLAHALNRDGPEAAAATRDEDAMFRVLSGRARALGLDGKSGPRAAADVVAQHISGRYREAADGPPWPAYTVGTCGTAPAEICALAYRMSVNDAAAGQPLTAPCAGGAAQESVVAAGLPGWGDELSGVAAETWARLCK
jgi:hypothetical protein